MWGCNCLGRKINNWYTYILFIKQKALVGEPGAVSGHEAHRRREDASKDREHQPAPSGP